MTRETARRSVRAAIAATAAPLLVALTSTGCVSAGLAAAGPMLAAVVAVADRSVERTLPADMSRSWQATAEVLSRAAIRIQESDRAGESWSLTGRGDSLSVSARLERVTPALTRLSLRAETGGLTADKQTAEVIVNQITAALAAPAVPSTPAVAPSPAASAEAVSALRREIERLGSRIDQGPSLAPSPRPSSPVIEPGRVLPIPASAGVPGGPAAAGMPSRAPVIGEAARAGGPAIPHADHLRALPGSSLATMPEVTAPAMAPVGALSPLDPLAGNGSPTR